VSLAVHGVSVSTLTDDGRSQTVGDLSVTELAGRLRERGLGVRLGCFAAHIRSDVEDLPGPLHSLYRDYPLLDEGGVYSFHVELREKIGRRFARKVRFIVDGRVPHEDLPIGQALAVLEWGMNLVIALRMHCFLMLHAGAVERHGRLMLLPASPGSGKTTLCAALVHRGWRLFSDEFALVRPHNLDFVPLPRPMPLKNESIEVIKALVPEAELGPTIPNTRKGTIAHVKAPAASIRDASRTSQPRWVVFPRWARDAPLALEPVPAPDAFMSIATNSFNYELLGDGAFATLRDTIDAARCFRLTYSDLDEAVAALADLADRDAA
jgi:HprK-related kinase A